MLIFLYILFQQLQLSEIMYNPPGSDTDNEFIEICNPSNQSISLAGKFVLINGDQDLIKHVSGPLLIAPKSYALLFDSTYFKGVRIFDDLIPLETSIFKITDPAFGTNGLINTQNKKIELLDQNSNLLDSVTYIANFSDGYSYERKIKNDLTWKKSYDYYGSPGFKNSNDIYEDSVKISYELQKDPLSISIKFINQENRSRTFQFTLNWHINYYLGEGENTVIKTSDFILNTSLNAYDSLIAIIPIEYFSEGAYQLATNFSIDNHSVLNDSTDLVNFTSLFPLRINYLKLNFPQIIGLENISNDVLKLHTFYLRTDSLFKEVNIGYDFKPKEQLFISKYTDSLNALWIEDIPRLSSLKDKLVIGFEGLYDSLAYNGNIIPYFKSYPSISPINSEKFNRFSKWQVINTVDRQPKELSSFNLKIKHNPFSPNNDGFEDDLIVELNYNEFEFVELKIYSINGELIYNFSDSPSHFGVGEWKWNGMTQFGFRVTKGPYILLVKCKDRNSGQLLYKKYPIIVAE